MSTNQTLSVRIPKEDLEKLDELASLEERPRSQLVQEALTDLLKKNKKLRNLESARTKQKKTQACN